MHFKSTIVISFAFSPLNSRASCMRNLIDLIITEEEQEPLTLNLSENIKIKELIELLQHSTEEELKDFLNEFEKAIKRVSIDRLNRTREIFEFNCTELKINYKIAAGKPSSSKLLQSVNNWTFCVA